MATSDSSKHTSMQGDPGYADDGQDSGLSNSSDDEQNTLIKTPVPFNSKARLSQRSVTPTKGDASKSSGNISRRISSQPSFATVPCTTCNGKGKLSQGK